MTGPSESRTGCEPAFFVLTPTHNRARRIARAIDSVREQSYGNWSHYILDDGSSDDTPSVLARFEDDPRIHAWRFEKNRGVNPARNFLLERILERAEPGFVVILDDDDRLEKDALAGFARAIDEDPSALWLIANCHLPSGARVSRIRRDLDSLCYVRDHKLGENLSGDVAHVFHTSIIADSRFIDSFPNAEEWWFYAGLAERSKMHVVDVHAKTVEYLDDGLTLQQPNKERAAEIYALKLERFDRFLNRRQRASLEARLGRHLYARGDREEGLRTLASAFLHWPFEPRIYLYSIQILLRSLGRAMRRPD
jgi:glycosyltransferase involved in cell wall biosynthesis